MAQMRAVLVKNDAGGIDDLFIGKAPKPQALAGQVLVRVKAFGVNRMDIMQREGKYNVPAGASKIMGVEFSGIIAEVGPNVTQWKADDEVIGLVGGGAYAEYVVAPEANIWLKPKYLSWAESAAIPENWITAYQALTIAEIKAGDSVLVHTGASGVGLAANQIARTWKAKHVFTTASTTEKLEWLLKMDNGPTHAINYKTQDFVEEIKKVTNGRGVDVVIDFPGQSHFVKNLDALAVDGRMTMLAMLSGTVVPSLNLLPLLYKRLRVQGSTLRSRSAEYQAELISRFKKDIADKVTGEDGDGPFRIRIHHIFQMERIKDAHREMEGNSTIGKLIVLV